MKILFDTNVLLDVLLDRQPYSEHAAYLLSKVERSEIQGYICAITLTTVHYLLAKSLGKARSKKYIKLILSLFKIAPVNKAILEKAINNKFIDFEDSVIYESGIFSGVEYIVTRNIKDYKYSQIPVYEPFEFIKIISNL